MPIRFENSGLRKLLNPAAVFQGSDGCQHRSGAAVVLAIFREQFIESRWEVVRGIFNKHKDSQKLKLGINTELILDFIYGALWYRLLIEHAPLDECFADELVDHVLILILK
jgi:hypothetical protein